uniref:Rab-GAP TBC domain-containing protein n=1 Tax=Syphacia muris TaxID=451379 RepID=A0A0N5AEZ9_9BILA
LYACFTCCCYKLNEFIFNILIILSVSDAWETSVSLDTRAATTSAAKVLERHAAMCNYDPIMPPVSAVPSKNGKMEAMQRLAVQKDPIPSSAVQSCNISTADLYPKLPKVCEKVNVHIFFRDYLRFERLKAHLGIGIQQDNGNSSFTVDLEKLRKDCWMGIPHKLRPMVWRILSGYLPANFERQHITVKKKRDEYWHCVEQYFHTRFEEQHQETFRQIHIDIPRMCPLIPLFQQKVVQEIFERILYIWAIRHPASGYVQGINDLVTPFFVVFLSEFVSNDIEVGTYDVSQLSKESLDIVEADSFWCVTALLDTIQDNYTFAQPGIQRKVLQLQHLMSRVANAFLGKLHNHLEEHGVEYLQFAFRWMNNLLMREIPLRATIRLWDTYLSEWNGFSHFHCYVCAAFLRMWSKQLLAEKDFQGMMILLQNLPTHNWGDQQICELTADAFSLMSVFDGAKNHFT